MRTAVDLIRMDVLPIQMLSGLPEGFIREYEEGQGFEDRLMVVPTENTEFISVRISYDGESELIASVEVNMYDYSIERCASELRGLFGSEDCS